MGRIRGALALGVVIFGTAGVVRAEPAPPPPERAPIVIVIQRPAVPADTPPPRKNLPATDLPPPSASARERHARTAHDLSVREPPRRLGSRGYVQLGVGAGHAPGWHPAGAAYGPAWTAAVGIELARQVLALELRYAALAVRVRPSPPGPELATHTLGGVVRVNLGNFRVRPFLLSGIGAAEVAGTGLAPRSKRVRGREPHRAGARWLAALPLGAGIALRAFGPVWVGVEAVRTVFLRPALAPVTPISGHWTYTVVLRLQKP